jgi:oligopeptide/dipeptide ABC transporter ATP-binding protein
MKQRVLLAEALSVNPSLILADEPTKGLDHSAAAEIMELIKGLNTKTVLTVTHDLIFARALGGRILVMLAGIVVEEAPADSFFRSPLHPYSQALIAAQPSRCMKEIADFHISGIMRDVSGCPYRQECLIANRQCKIRPPLRFFQGHKIRCWHDVS